MVFTKDWTNILLAQMAYIKRKANSKAEISGGNLNEPKEHLYVTSHSLVLSLKFGEMCHTQMGIFMQVGI